MNNWIEVAGDKLAANYRAIEATAGESTEILAVVKANGYGHGAEFCSVALVRAGARWLGVTCAAEGARVRHALTQAGLAAEILVMCGFTAEETPLLVERRMQPVVWTLEQVAWLRGTALPVHIEIDTGMNRQGARPGAELAGLLTSVQEAGLRLEGLLTHFSSSEDANSPQTALQRERFAPAVAQAVASGLRPVWLHAGASSAVDNPAQPAAWLSDLAASAGARPMMRIGIALYGYCMPVAGATPRMQPRLQPVMTWKARVLSLRALAAGDSIGYNSTYTARESMRVALLPVGFADGLRRELSSTNDRPGGWVMLHGRRAAVLGRISMNLTVVDVTGIPEIKSGDEAILLGSGITADDHARLAHTTAYEILCGVHPCG